MTSRLTPCGAWPALQCRHAPAHRHRRPGSASQNADAIFATAAGSRLSAKLYSLATSSAIDATLRRDARQVVDSAFAIEYERGVGNRWAG